MLDPDKDRPAEQDLLGPAAGDLIVDDHDGDDVPVPLPDPDSDGADPDVVTTSAASTSGPYDFG